MWFLANVTAPEARRGRNYTPLSCEEADLVRNARHGNPVTTLQESTTLQENGQIGHTPGWAQDGRIFRTPVGPCPDHGRLTSTAGIFLRVR